ncbi:MAG: IPT/TIG domain-containing protein, partial [Patescibacteria group bacterium]|nr:IPT/TIG domain-containing protein [Patescibacteria group bacterium]
MPFSRFFNVVKILIFLIILLGFAFFTPKNVFAGTETISFSSSSSVTTASGFVGDTTNTVFLSGGAKRTTYTIYWASTGTGTTVNLGTCATSGSSTTCSLAITIPHSSKGNWIIHDNSSGGNGANTLTFTVSPKIASVSPASGNRNTTVTVSGTGFAAETVNVYFGIPSTYLLGSATVTSGTGGTNGDLSVSAAAPSMPFNNYTMYATGALNGTITSSQAFNMQPSVSLSASSGPWGTTITISGWGFATSSAITIRQDGVDTATTGTADTNGAFTGISYTPTGVAGNHNIAAR